MPRTTATLGLPRDVIDHLENVASNLQLIADLWYGNAALAVIDHTGELTVLADARPNTAADPVAASRAGLVLGRDEDPEAHAAVRTGQPVTGTRRVLPGGATVTTEAYPIGVPEVTAVVIRTFGEQIETTTSRMENAFIEAARELLGTLRTGPLLDTRTGEPFWTLRRAGDGVLRVNRRGIVTYASPNAVSIMRNAGVESRVTGMHASELPGGGRGIAPLLGASGALAAELEVAGHTLSYRSLALATSVLVLVEDLTEARRRERELDVKETTIREVHHRVKNNLQTIASLLRMQARRSDDEDVRRALGEATARAASMAAVHDLLAHSDHECVDFVAVARRVVELVRSGAVGDDPGVEVHVSGSTGEIDAGTATSMALVLTELVHNALEHAFDPGAAGTVHVDVRRAGDVLTLVVRDDGRGLAPGVDLADSRGLGFSIVRTLVEEDLRGTLTTSQDGGTSFTIRVPLPPAGD
jgi:two-component system, sensor histidine kinase PdtaS